MPWYNSVTGEHVYSPSDEDKQRDELIYKPSVYAKEELPTWSEVYEEFYLGKQYTYSINDPNDQTMDPYWKIPHKKFLIATVCNQFNKMIFEDGLKDEILSELSKEFCTEITGLKFTCGKLFYPDICIKCTKDNDEVFNNITTIYTIPNPSGKPNPFITSNCHRENITEINDVIELHPIIRIIDKEFGNIAKVPKVNDEHFNIIIDVMIKRFKEYFEGDIGWKDSDGNLIEGDPVSHGCTGAGYTTK